MQQWRKHSDSLRLTLVLSVYRAVASTVRLRSYVDLTQQTGAVLLQLRDTRSGAVGGLNGLRFRIAAVRFRAECGYAVGHCVTASFPPFRPPVYCETITGDARDDRQPAEAGTHNTYISDFGFR